MREIEFNGYIDEETFFGDEITPEMLHGMLYGPDGTMSDDVHIRLNSYGGSCNAATRMFDDIRAYPGKVRITVSGTAASAATVVCMAADRLEMTLGSLFMIHDPSTVAFGNEQDMQEAIAVLRAAKESILNMYGIRSRVTRSDAAEMMKKTTWMDANEAFEKGFVDGIQEIGGKGPYNSTEHKVTLDAAKAGVQAWFDRKVKPYEAVRSEEVSNSETPCEDTTINDAAVHAEENVHGEEQEIGQAIGQENREAIPKAEAPEESGLVSAHDPPQTEAEQATDHPARPDEVQESTADQGDVTHMEERASEESAAPQKTRNTAPIVQVFPEPPRTRAADLMARLSLLK